MRRSGKTTREIDRAIQVLFERGKIIFPTRAQMKDEHFTVGKSNEYMELLIFDADAWKHQGVQDDLRNKVMQRLRIEHRMRPENTEFIVTKNTINWRFHED